MEVAAIETKLDTCFGFDFGFSFEKFPFQFDFSSEFQNFLVLLLIWVKYIFSSF